MSFILFFYPLKNLAFLEIVYGLFYFLGSDNPDSESYNLDSTN